jgi:RNA polymerase sigma-70 factor (sigma-E family)
VSETQSDFTKFVQERGPGLLRFATALTGDRHLQAVLERAYPRWTRIARRGDPEWYVRRSVVNAAKDGWRGDHRRSAVLERLGAEEENTYTPFDEYVTRDAVRRALRELPPGQRTVVVLRYWERLSEAETAELMGISVGTVKSQAHRAMRTLRASLELREGLSLEPVGSVS